MVRECSVSKRVPVMGLPAFQWAVGFCVMVAGSGALAVSPSTPMAAAPGVMASPSTAAGSSSSAGKSTRPGQAGASSSLTPSQLILSPPTSTIHWVVNKDGSVELSDRPVAGNGNVVRQGVEHYAGSSDAESLARGRRERDYWREQSNGFASRQRDRDRELDQRRQQALARAERDLYGSAGYSPYYFVPGFYGGRGFGGFPVGAVPGANNGIPVSGTFPSAGQTAALGGGSSPFLSSGFARDLRR